jgi:hypothetical protein
MLTYTKRHTLSQGTGILNGDWLNYADISIMEARAILLVLDTTEGVMDERITRLRAHLRNIDRYQSLLETKLSDAEQRYLERRLSEERFAITALNFTGSEINMRSSQNAKPD